MTAEAFANGSITQVVGPAVDVEFPAGQLPNIFTALTVSNPEINDKLPGSGATVIRLVERPSSKNPGNSVKSFNIHSNGGPVLPAE